MKMKQLHPIEYLKALHPELEYDCGDLYCGEELLCTEVLTKRMIEDYYDGWEITKAHWTNNPELEYFETVGGKEYIEYKFVGDYEQAFLEI